MRNTFYRMSFTNLKYPNLRIFVLVLIVLPADFYHRAYLLISYWKFQVPYEPEKKPFECKPLEARPIATCPGSIELPSIILSFSTTPTQNPARS